MFGLSYSYTKLVISTCSMHRSESEARSSVLAVVDLALFRSETAFFICKTPISRRNTEASRRTVNINLGIILVIRTIYQAGIYSHESFGYHCI
jgi:hypothetical protein